MKDRRNFEKVNGQFNNIFNTKVDLKGGQFLFLRKAELQDVGVSY